MESGKVVAITRQRKLLNETNITMEVTTEDPEFKAAGGEWGKPVFQISPLLRIHQGKELQGIDSKRKWQENIDFLPPGSLHSGIHQGLNIVFPVKAKKSTTS